MAHTSPLPVGIASELLDCATDLLEMNARKFRSCCQEELEIISVTGIVPGHSKVRAILLQSASLMRTDIQELESLNSMVKLAVLRSNNNRISLALLSSRVCLRKLIAMNAPGCRVRDIKPFAACLARSATIFGEGYHSLQDDESRWESPSSNNLNTSFQPGKPLLYDPVDADSLQASRWAMKYHTLFMKQFRLFWKDKTVAPNKLMALVVPCHSNDRNFVSWASCMTVGKQVLMVKLCAVGNDGALAFAVSNSKVGSSSGFEFQTSLAIIASLCTIATDRKNRGEPMLGISVQEMNMKLTLQDGSIIDPVGPPSEVCKLRARYAHKPKPKQNNKDDAIDDEDDTSENDGNVNTGQSSDMSDGDDSASDEDIVSKQCREKERDAQVMKLLFSDDDNEIDDASSVNDAGSDFDNNDFDQLSQLNVSMAASAANRTAQVSEIGITEAADALQDQCDSAKKTDSTAFMSDADQQQEAILQQILLGQSGHGPGCNGNSHGDCKPHDKSYDPTIGEAERFRFEQSVAEPMANAFVDHWKINVRQICEALTFREQGKDKPRGDNGEMSLVLEVKDETATVKFVQWSTSNLKHGREIFLDSDNKIICPVNFIQRARDFQTPHIHMVVPAVGASVRKVRKSDRPEMPSLIVAIWTMFKDAIASHVRVFEEAISFDDASIGIHKCQICLSDDVRSNIHRCAFCALSCHRTCNSVLAEKTDKSEHSVAFDLPGVSIGMLPRMLLAPAPMLAGANGPNDSSDESQCSWSSSLALAIVNGRKDFSYGLDIS